ncbi:DNA-directed RNA polymerase I subunit RPA1 [Marchantia polymorpha subsp. ruderalis]|uniref:DNA-directed RNA polymerase subunit n=2 Tax=Marchantia polymorpha TaxID=3197 RepID=A0AAF6BPM0_MARPO|nr:hypothetical protein MARPO_0053s0083 [Marchantia polymorpha]BBN13954.1 hypothetical protein Mp_6g07700 [Marchantia polymorpha subsp. ruderalis]|eukprot:PTQ38156.1 hypothetical protein MARPO_0053s0083 [Marchantia polymorpha]
MREVVCKAIDAVEFSFYNDEEIHAISVKHITSPVLFDNLRNAVPGGLYDGALGPLDKFSSCITCGQQPINCPGHCGHINLMLPVYNPLVYKNVLKIYRSVCIYCHNFKMHKNRVTLFSDKLELISQGRMVEAMNVVVKKVENEGDNMEEIIQGGSFSTGLDEEMGEDGSSYRGETGDEDVAAGKRHFTASQIDATKEVISQFMSSMPPRKCENCLAHVPAIRNEGVGKLFQLPLPKGSLASNIMRGLKSVINIASGNDDTERAKDEDVEMEENDISENAIEEIDEKKIDRKMRETDQADVRNQTKFLTPSEVKEHLRLTWENEERICSLIWGAQEAYGLLTKSKKDVCGSDMFFLQTILVTPNRFRPPNRMDDQILEHPQNIFYSRVIQANISLTESSRGAKGDLNFSKATALWLNLQNAVNALLDSTTAIGSKADAGGNGVRQLLEKKEGLFRMNMMGKRVNFACRSVISPDPYIAVNEIGIPPYFATRLTYPERVTPWNVQQLRDAVENGPSTHPGATHVEDEDGKLTNLASLPSYKRAAIAKTLLSASGLSGANVSRGADASSDVPRSGGKTVYRHLRSGDILLVNRQPTLHKPGVMAHKARVLKGEKTLRMHYANCSTYNADFDGDEMNVHFPQDELGRSEGYNIVNADEQFVVPTSGDPIRGLIQDHVVGAVLLTKRDTFLTREEYMQIVYAAVVSSTSPTLAKKKSALGMIERDRPIKTLPPAIQKPKQLWTGKQVMTTVFNYITHGSPPFSMSAGIKTPKEYWGLNSGENIVLLQDNELICGVIDKAQFGKYGIVHAFQELYGCAGAGKLLSVFSRLFTNYLQMHGFTCGIGDLLLVPKAEKERRHKLRKADKLGDSVHAKFIGDPETQADIDVERVKDQVEKILRAKGEPASNRLDRMMSGALNGVTSEVNNAMFPKGLMKAFPGNWFTMMTVTGAKGGLVNFTQISSLLGQQELEGKRVPRMVSGKTLPCFSPWDTGARAGGFIGDRFLSGLRPQEYYFHCMAGRDGLVDTAVKTSRSGYLQRCLVKNLEGLKIHYDYTVRDSDGSIVQFKYGEDGIDVLKTSYLTKFELLADNQSLVSRRLGKDEMQTERSKQKDTSSQSKETEVEEDMALGGVSPAFNQKVEDFLKGLPKKELKRLNLRKSRQKDDFKFMMQLKFITSLAPPGEPVGVLAAQSVGEPSTQMTLNTFHFAGRGEMNVTLGIPRLREILMTASENISTPIMTCPLRSHLTKEDGERLAMTMRRLRLVDLIETVDVGEIPFSVQQGIPKRVYKIRIKLYSPKRFPPGMNLTLKECETILRDSFIPRLEKEVKAATRGHSKQDAIGFVPLRDLGEGAGESGAGVDDDGVSKASKKGKEVDEGEQAEDEEEDEGDEEGADAEKRKSQGTDERGYADEEDDDEKAIAKDLLQEDELTREEEVEEEEDGAGGGKANDNNGSGDQQANTEEGITPMKLKKLKTPKRANDNMLQMDGSTFEMQFTSSQQTNLVLMPELVEKVAKQVSVRYVKGIDKCSVIETKDKKNPDGPPLYALQTDGVNLEGFWALHDDLDVNNLTTNNIATILRVYGVEAARQTIMSEVLSVFGSYGIGVNPRHLSLISDFMTCQGGYRPCNRLGIYSSPSPFLKMSYETATTFLMDATLKRQRDNLSSPSARIVMGRVVESGTGSFELLQNIDAFIDGKA